MNILCKIGLHHTYWCAFVQPENGELFEGHICKRCKKMWDSRDVPRSFEIGWAIKNMIRAIVGSRK